MVLALGTRRLGAANLTGLTFLYPFVRCFRAHPTPVGWRVNWKHFA